MDLGLSDDGTDGLALTDDEFCSLALGMELGLPLSDDAVPLTDYLDAQRVGGSGGLLPNWYMPAPMTRVGPKWRTPVVLAIVAAFLSIEAAGLCSTFGQIVPA